jgi:hypothetical protein
MYFTASEQEKYKWPFLCRSELWIKRESRKVRKSHFGDRERKTMMRTEVENVLEGKKSKQ